MEGDALSDFAAFKNLDDVESDADAGGGFAITGSFSIQTDGLGDAKGAADMDSLGTF